MVFMEVEGGGKGQPTHGRIRDMLGGHLHMVVLVVVVVSLVAAGMVALVATRHNHPHVAPPQVAPPHVAPPHVAISVDDVCVKSAYPQACAQILNSDPRNTTEDIFVIAQIAVDKAVTSMTSTDNKIKSLLAQTEDASLRRSLTTCMALFDFSKDNLGSANELIRTRKAGSLNGIGGVVNLSGIDCHKSVGGPLLLEETYEARVIGEVIATISIFFGKKI